MLGSDQTVEIILHVSESKLYGKLKTLLVHANYRSLTCTWKFSLNIQDTADFYFLRIRSDFFYGSIDFFLIHIKDFYRFLFGPYLDLGCLKILNTDQEKINRYVFNPA